MDASPRESSTGAEIVKNSSNEEASENAIVSERHNAGDETSPDSLTSSVLPPQSSTELTTASEGIITHHHAL